MIPNLATIIAAYVGFRMLEVFLFNTSRYSSRGVHIVAGVFAVFVGLATIFSWLNIILAPSTR
ncbi:MAG TPA: hypothetical protein VMI93_02450 [Candidatus Solibacter sp.]|nr:hypothetical protein [Candidatus Solibacter sp.]